MLKKVKHRLVENMSSGTADALGLSRAILCNGESWAQRPCSMLPTELLCVLLLWLLSAWGTNRLPPWTPV